MDANVLCKECECAFTVGPGIGKACEGVVGHSDARVVRCRHCKKRVQPDPSFFGVPTLCPSCHREFTVEAEEDSDKLIVFRGDPHSLKILTGIGVVGGMFAVAAFQTVETSGQLITVLVVAAMFSAIGFVIRSYYGGVEQ